MNYTPLQNVCARIESLLTRYPLAVLPDPRLSIPAPPSDEHERLLWAIPFLEISTDALPFCTKSAPACGEALNRFLRSADTLRIAFAQTAERLSEHQPASGAALLNMAEHCGDYASQATLKAAVGKLTLSDFRSVFGTYLAPVIRYCCDMMFDSQDPTQGAALMQVICNHLREIGVSTADHSGLTFDYDHYDPFYVKETTDKLLDDQYHTILLPAYFLGRSNIIPGSASCYCYRMER